MIQSITRMVLLIIVSKLILRNTIVFLAKIMISVLVKDTNELFIYLFIYSIIYLFDYLFILYLLLTSYN